MRLHPAPPQETNNILSTEQRRRKASCGAASLVVAAAATALVVVLAAASSISGRREMNAAAVADLFRPNAKRVPPAQRPDIENTIGEHADNTNIDGNMEQTQQHPRRNQRRLEDADEEIEQHRGHHHDEGDEENTDELTFSENDEEPAAEENIESAKEALDDSDSNENQDGDIAPPQSSLYNPEPKPESSQLELSTVVESITEEEQIFQVQEMAERLRPRPMLSFDANATKQFAHLHHMKTGGTSINHLLNCALGRARTLYQQTQTQTDAGAAGAAGGSSRRGRVLPFYSLEECSHSRYLTCIGNDNSTSAQSCRSNIESASVMQYCAPLHQMSRFDWLDADIVSVIRHPVDRVWSMFRFQTKSCFQCTPLLDIYRHIEEGTLDEFCGEKGCGGVCIPQLLNHETRNLLTDTWDENDAGGVSLSTDEEKLQEALFNLKSRVTLVGVTDELPVFAAMLGKVFPWLAESVTAEELGMATGGGDGSSRRTKLRRAATSTGTTEPKSCPLTHANASPKNNRCAPGNKHWDLPEEPDEETREAILRHNQLDLKIYEAAKARFQLQKEALGLH